MIIWKQELVIIWHPDATVESHIAVLAAITKWGTLHPIYFFEMCFASLQAKKKLS